MIGNVTRGNEQTTCQRISRITCWAVDEMEVLLSTYLAGFTSIIPVRPAGSIVKTRNNAHVNIITYRGRSTLQKPEHMYVE